MIKDGFYYNGIDYNKTVNTNRLVIKGQKLNKIVSYIFILLIIYFGISGSFWIGKSFINDNSSLTDYLMSIVFPLIILFLVYVGCKNLLTRDKLKEIHTNINIEKAKIKLLEAAKNLKWRPDSITDNYMIFVTNFDFLTGSQTVRLIFTPNNKIYFNSIQYSNDYLKPARFENNYLDLINEFKKIEKIDANRVDCPVTN
ncbi:MAG: hypothetical protein ACOYLE_10590 [Bacteroidales bacterium]